jgi:hypothetical protein
MKKLMFSIAVAVFALGTAAAAHDTATPHKTRGDCEAALAQINNVDRDWLATTFPGLFATYGDVMKHLHEDFQCEYNADDGLWYIVDHRFD